MEIVIRKEKALIAERTREVEDKIAYCRSLLPRLVSHLKEHYQVSGVVLIGSLTDDAEHFTLESDIDLVVKGLAPSLYFRAWSEINEIAEDNVDIDLIDWNSANHFMKTITKRWGEVLYERC